MVLLLIFEFFFTFFLVVSGKTVGSSKLSPKVIRTIKKEGLYHLTTKHELIMQGEYAHLLPSSRFSSYSNGFKPAVFFFAGKPTKVSSIFNLRKEAQKAMTAIWIRPEDISDEFLSKLRYRKLDNAVMYTGELYHKAQVVKLDSVEENIFDGIKFGAKLIGTVLGCFLLSIVISSFAFVVLNNYTFIG